MRIILPPLKWNRATDGIDVDAAASLRWATEHERSLLPGDTLFPRAGQIWETLRECEVSFEARMTYSGPAFTKVHLPNGGRVILQAVGPRTVVFPFGTARLLKGEKVRVLPGPDATANPKPLCVHLQPLRYEELHESIVPAPLRTASAYTGYRLCVRTARPANWFQERTSYLSEDFRLAEDVPDKPG